MRVLVACEESQRVTISFRDRGHDAFSCDLKKCSGGHPEWHIKEDVLYLLKYDRNFDLLIGHPPCTYLSSVGSILTFDSLGHIKNRERFENGLRAAEFFLALWNQPIPHICLENPAPIKAFGLPPYSQHIEPFYFGDPYKKRTLLWLKNLPLLEVRRSDVVKPRACWVTGKGSRIKLSCELPIAKNQTERSKTFWGIARAMAEQWSDLSSFPEQLNFGGELYGDKY